MNYIHVAIHVLTVFFQGHPQKKGVSSRVEKIKIKSVKHASFVNHLCSVSPVENVHNVAQNLPVGGRLRDFWKVWASQGASPKEVSILKNGYNFPFKVKPPLTRISLVKIRYANSLHKQIPTGGFALVFPFWKN